jgi:transposase
MEVIRQNVGIDILKDSFVATFTVLLKDQIVKHLSTKEFKNDTKGFVGLYKWHETIKDVNNEVNFTMEATGVYYESLAYYLYSKEATIHVLLPNKAKKFGESLNIKSKTDKIDSKMLGHMGAERLLEKWELSSETYKTFYERLKSKKKHNSIAGTAVQRKLLGLIYTFWKNDEPKPSFR